jgi:hypothetical protein
MCCSGARWHRRVVYASEFRTPGHPLIVRSCIWTGDYATTTCTITSPEAPGALGVLKYLLLAEHPVQSSRTHRTEVRLVEDITSQASVYGQVNPFDLVGFIEL